MKPEVMAWFLVLYCFSEPGGDGVVSCFVLFQGTRRRWRDVMFCPVSMNPEVMAWFLVLSCFSEAGGDGIVL